MILKKSQAHVEIILATTLFVGFLVFLFFFMRSSSKITQDVPIEKVQLKLLESMQEKIGKLPIILESSDSCFHLNNLVKDYGIDFRWINESSNSKLITVYYGNFLEKNSVPVCEDAKKKFKTGAYIEERIIFEGKIKELVSSYNSDYAGLKQNLGIINFEFGFKDRTENMIDEFSVKGRIPQNANVASKEFPVRVINSKAEISELILNIKAWK